MSRVTRVWILVIVVGTLTFLGNDIYKNEQACQGALGDVRELVSAAQCADLEALVGSEPERVPGPNGRMLKPDGPPGPRDDSDG